MTTNLNPAEMLTVEQIAEMLKTSKMTVYRTITDGHLRAYRIRRQIRVRRDDLEAYLKGADTWGES